MEVLVSILKYVGSSNLKIIIMSYINKENQLHISEIVELGYIKNIQGYTTNPTISYGTFTNIDTNEIKGTFFTVSAFEKDTSIGYHRSKHEFYKDAKIQFDSLIKEFHVL
jgi:transaldolase